MNYICGRHKDGCPKPHKFSVPVEALGIDVVLPEKQINPGVILCDGDSLTIRYEDHGVGVHKFTFTHHGVSQEYTGSEHIVREGLLVTPW